MRASFSTLRASASLDNSLGRRGLVTRALLLDILDPTEKLVPSREVVTLALVVSEIDESLLP